jgi:hypothetical protein
MEGAAAVVVVSVVLSLVLSLALLQAVNDSDAAMSAGKNSFSVFIVFI